MKPVLHNQDLCCPSEVVCHCHLVQTGLAEMNTCEFGFPGAQVQAVPGSARAAWAAAAVSGGSAFG